MSFPGLSPGAYPTHLHSECNGSQSYHILVLQTLVVGGAGAGTIQVPSAYFGRGLCIIVYTSPSLTRVYTTRRI
ncbi:MAG: hypothetical protein ACYDHE_06390 [Candidatus Acidiferrales bacterium]